MAINSVSWHWLDAYPPGYHTVTVNVAPGSVSAQAALSTSAGGGINYTGIMQYFKHLPNGVNQLMFFGDWPTWPPGIWDTISSVTFATFTGDGQELTAIWRLDFWG